MTKMMDQYNQIVTTAMSDIIRDEESAILQAAEILAEILADKVVEGKLINIYGAGGHSAIAAMEIFWRAGGIAQVNAMFPTGTNIISAGPTTAKLEGYAPYILNFYDV